MLDPTPSSPSSSLELSRKLGCVIIPLHWQSRVTPHPVTQRGFQTRGPGPKPRAACPFHAGCISMTCPACRKTPSNPRAKYFQDSLHLTTDLHLGSMASDNLQQAAQSHTNQDICRGFRKLCSSPRPTLQPYLKEAQPQPWAQRPLSLWASLLSTASSQGPSVGASNKLGVKRSVRFAGYL